MAVAIDAYIMIMFSDVHYHRGDATEQRDTITLWSAARALQAGSVTRHSWDYANPLVRQFVTVNATSMADQGVRGRRQGIDIEALAVKVVAQGAQADFGGGAITQQSSGPHTIKSSCFDQLGAGDATPEGVKLPTSEIEHDQQVQLTDQVSFEPAPHRKYRITAEDGAVVEGVSDANGLTECFANKPAFAHYKIELLD